MSDATYLFLDEAGNFDFSASGTRHFVLTSVAARRPFAAHAPLDAYRHDLLEYGRDQKLFHCAEENRHVRGRVFDIIGANLSALRIDSLVVDKAKTGPALRDDQRFYPEMLGYLLKYVLPRELLLGASQIIVITDRIPVMRKRRAVEKAIQQALAGMLPGIPHRILHHESATHYGLQVADFCNWAVYRKWERGERDAYDAIQPALRSEFDIFERGTRRYY